MRLVKECAAVVLLLVWCASARAAQPPLASSFDFSQYEGRVVMVDFWASWCPPCLRSFPWFNRMQQKYAAAGLVVLGVNTDAKWSDAEKFLVKTPANFPLLFDADGSMHDKFGVTGMPTTILFDRHGSQVATHLGFDVAKEAEYERVLREVLDRKE
jgi:thiol-disulfide isomerase/thioredoxin